MFHLFVIPLREYWKMRFYCEKEIDPGIREFKEILSQHYHQTVDWDETHFSLTEEVCIETLWDSLFMRLKLVAAKYELDRSLEGLDLGVEEPRNSPIFGRLEAHWKAQECSFRLFPALLKMGQFQQCFVLPLNLPSSISINLNAPFEFRGKPVKNPLSDSECEIVDIVSALQLLIELDRIADLLGIDKKYQLQEDIYENPTVDAMQELKIAWYVLFHMAKSAMIKKCPAFFVENSQSIPPEEGDESLGLEQPVPLFEDEKNTDIHAHST